MALGKIMALLSLVSGLVLLAQAMPFRHGSSRLRGSPLADLLLAALDGLQGVDVVGLATRRNMVLPCHAILLLLLGDAGLLSAHARRRRAEDMVAGIASACYSPPPPEHARRSRDVAVGQRRGTSLVVAVEEPWATESEHYQQVADHVSTKEIIVLVQKQGTSLYDHRLVEEAEPDQPSATEAKTMISPMDFDRAVVVAGDQDNNGQEEEAAAATEVQPADECGVQEEEEEDDLDEMNRRFEVFIATTKEKMRLEALHPLSGENSACVTNSCH